MRNLKVLVLGNDPQINSIDFSRLAPDVITLGVNRIWLRHVPHYFFFNDVVILEELNLHPEILEKVIADSTSFSSDWVTRKKKEKMKEFPEWLTIHPRRVATRFPDSVTTAMQLFNQHYLESSPCKFYIAGVSLIWQEKSHFWKQLNYRSKNTYTKEWYQPRFEQILKNFQDLKKLRYQMISVNPDSLLNRMLRYEHIGNLYSK